jgi:hypothetical protein
MLRVMTSASVPSAQNWLRNTEVIRMLNYHIKFFAKAEKLLKSG